MGQLDLASAVVGVDGLLAKSTDDRTRRMLLNYRRHAMLEISGRWQEISPDMMAPDPEGYDQFEHCIASFWRYDDNCLLMGEYVYEQNGAELVEIEPADFLTQQRAAEILAPLIDASPLE